MKNLKTSYCKFNLIFISFVLSISFLIGCINFTVVKADSLSTYDLRDYGFVTSVKNQGEANTCWAFCATGAIESSLIVGGYADSSIDLSESHLGWFAINSAISDADDLTYGDGYSVPNPYQYGGNDLYVIWALSRGFGLELEEYAKYNTENANSTLVKESERYVSEFTVTEVNIFDRSEIQNIKNAILSNGALMAAYRDSAMHYNDSKDGYCFFEDQYTNSNHATLIVGWDDNFSKENFGIVKPSTDGAWLCRNTRGEAWGDDGYFWMSYETSSLKRIVSFKAEPTEDNVYQIYQYDGYGFSKSLSLNNSGIVYNSNIFDVKENGTLSKIAFYTAMPDLKHEITVYALNDGYTSPTDGNIIAEFNKECPYTGYYLCNLPTEIELSGGTSFSVVLKISGNGRISFYSEGTENRTSSTGKSFVSGDGSNWLDTAEQNFGNLCIKAWIDPNTYISPNVKEIYDLMLPISEEYYEDSSLSKVIEHCKNILSSNGTEREILNNYLRLCALYEKYYGAITIDNEEQFLAFAKLVNSGKDFAETVVLLTNDLDFTGIDFSYPSRFGGIFNGQNHTIKGINLETTDEAGLFGMVLSYATIKNIVLTDSNFISSGYVGGIASRNAGVILDCASSAFTKSLYVYSGGIVGFNEGIIKNCTAKSHSNENNHGGISGNNPYGIIENCITESDKIISNGNAPQFSYLAYQNNDFLVIKGSEIDSCLVYNFARMYNIHEKPNSDIAYTGMILGDMKLVLVGDTDGDGILSSSDYLRIKSYFLNRTTLSDSQRLAADIDNSGIIESTDYLLIKSHFLNKTNIYGA